MTELLQGQFLISYGRSAAIVHWKFTVPFAHIFSRSNRPPRTVWPKANWDYRSSLTGSCVFCHIRVLAMGNSIKEAISIMKPKQIIISILAVLFVFPLMGTFAQQAPNSISITVITTFDYPGTVISTQPQKINDEGTIVGIYFDSLAARRGFVRFSNGNFSAPIVEPKHTENITEGRGINNSRTVCGDYVGSDDNGHGFFLSRGTFTEYNITN